MNSRIVIIDGILSLYHNRYKFVQNPVGYRDHEHADLVETNEFSGSWYCHNCNEFFDYDGQREYDEASWEFKNELQPRLYYLEQWTEDDYGSEGWEVYDASSISISKAELVAKATRLLLNDTKINLRVIELIWEN